MVWQQESYIIIFLDWRHNVSVQGETGGTAALSHYCTDLSEVKWTHDFFLDNLYMCLLVVQFQGRVVISPGI